MAPATPAGTRKRDTDGAPSAKVKRKRVGGTAAQGPPPSFEFAAASAGHAELEQQHATLPPRGSLEQLAATEVVIAAAPCSLTDLGLHRFS
jgi:hypothetical protein